MHPMLKLLADNRRLGTFRAEESGDSATIYLYDAIVDSDLEAEWWGGVSPQRFAEQLAAIKASTIHLRVNSPGGSVFAARAMEQALREHSATVIAHIDGLAASAASFLVTAADEIVMAPGAMIMIHKAWTIAWGNSDDLVATAGLLEQIDGTLVRTYEARTGQSADDIAEWMRAETWFDAPRAVELGFADREAGAEQGDAESASARAKARSQAATWNLSAYKNAPHTPRDRSSSPAPAAPPPAGGGASFDTAAALRRLNAALCAA